MKIALIQCNPLTGACADNANMLENAVMKAADRGADLCVAPQLALCGPNAGDLLLRNDFARSCRHHLEGLAEKISTDSGLPPLLLGAPAANPDPGGKALHNGALFIQESRLEVVSRKCLLAENSVMNETRYFDSGLSCGVLQFKGWNFAVAIGEDAWNSRVSRQSALAANPLANTMLTNRIDAILALAALPYAQGGTEMHEQAMRRLAQQYQVPVLTTNLVGGFDSLVFPGGAMALDAKGTLLGRSPLFQEDLLIIDLDEAGKSNTINAGTGPSRQFPEEISSSSESSGPTESPNPSPEGDLWQALVLGTRDFVRKSGFSKAVVGLSGGIDSALVVAVAVDAFGPDNVTALMMPSPYSSAGSVDDSVLLAQNLGIATVTLPLSPVMEGYSTVLTGTFKHGVRGLTEENIQARIRGALLMAFANEYGSVVLNTGNKSEAACGYCTLYGDMVGALCVIADLYKHQVYALCRWFNQTRGPVIPQAIFDKAPSAELAPGQKDSDSLPPYDELDAILHLLIAEHKGVQEMVDAGHNRETVHKIVKLVNKAQFKRQQAPTALQLSTSSFARVWNMPIACKPQVM